MLSDSSEDEDEAVQDHETANGCPSVADPAGNGTCQEDADECTNWSTTLER